MSQPKFTKQWLEYVATSNKPNDDIRWWTVNYYMLYYPIPSLVFSLRFFNLPFTFPPLFLNCCLTLHLKPNVCFWRVWQDLFFPPQYEVFWRPNAVKQLQIKLSCIVFAKRWRSHINLKLNAKIKPFYISLGIDGAKDILISFMGTKTASCNLTGAGFWGQTR